MTNDDLTTILHRWLGPVGDDLPELYAVGGAVRDHLLGRPLRDVDLACRNAAGFARLLADCQEKPATVVPFTRDRDAPCFRVVNRRRPEDFVDVVNLRGPTIEDDLERRDFTINAMAFRILPDGRLGDLIDCVNGGRDLGDRLIRACGSRALGDDPARVLRAARLSAQLDFSVTPDTRDAMAQQAARLTGVAAERLTAELLKLLSCPRCLLQVRLLDETGVLGVILPEISAAKGCRQNGYHHLDVWEHSLATLAACEEIIAGPEAAFGRAGPAVRSFLDQNNHLPLLKLAALLHDLGKPRVKQYDQEKERVTFHGHDRRGAELAAVAAGRLRFSSADTRLLTLMVEQHMRPVILFQPQVKQSTIIKWFREVNDASLLIMLLAMADVAAKSGERMACETKENFFAWARKETINYTEYLKKTFGQPSLVSGLDLLALGLAPGPAIGRILADIREQQDLGLITDRDHALRLLRDALNLLTY